MRGAVASSGDGFEKKGSWPLAPALSQKEGEKLETRVRKRAEGRVTRMTGEPTDGRSRTAQRVSPGGVAGAVLGVVLFVYAVQRAGLGEIADGIGRLGWLFLVVVALGGLRFAARGMAWRGCLEGPHRLTPGRAFQAVVAGDTLGNLTPFSLLVSEPAKALFVRDREPVSRTLAALAVENLFYTQSAVIVIAGGLLALVLRLRTADTWWLAGVGLVTALIVLISLAHAIIWRQVRVASGLFELVGRRGLAPRRVARWAERVRRVEDRGLRALPARTRPAGQAGVLGALVPRAGNPGDLHRPLAHQRYHADAARRLRLSNRRTGSSPRCSGWCRCASGWTRRGTAAFAELLRLRPPPRE